MYKYTYIIVISFEKYNKIYHTVFIHVTVLANNIYNYLSQCKTILEDILNDIYDDVLPKMLDEMVSSNPGTTLENNLNYLIYDNLPVIYNGLCSNFDISDNMENIDNLLDVFNIIGEHVTNLIDIMKAHYITD